MTSFINSRYGSIVTVSIPQGTASCYLFSVGIMLSVNAIQSEMRPVYSENYFTRPAVDVWCKKFALGREGVVDEERPDEMLFRR